MSSRVIYQQVKREQRIFWNDQKRIQKLFKRALVEKMVSEQERGCANYVGQLTISVNSANLPTFRFCMRGFQL
ncbi:MAG: hypothetical protein AYK19_14265 [Theionarchaea archaeon DG-70-1]|nr:MAG: hypothetical protein AYK19_14265 [Theionarchaea archaeon DG-70-1]